MDDKDKLDKKEKKMGEDNMEMEVIRERENYSIKDKLKMLSLRTREKRLKMKQCEYTEKNSVVNEELASIQQDIYNTIK